MANKTTVRKDGRYNTNVSIADKSGRVLQPAYIIMVDTGSADTFVNYEDAVKGGTWENGAVGGNIIIGKAVGFISVKGGTMTVETEAQGGGTIQNKTCSSIKGVWPSLDYGESATGLLGMDQMDVISADPQKNAAATAARMARRV